MLDLTRFDAATGALCVDGTTSGYYWKKSPTNSSIFILHLEGGGWCYDVASCTKRCGPTASPFQWNPLCSSKFWPSTLTVEGLLEPQDSPELASANKAYVKYCTSDAHMGFGESDGRLFRGARVVRAVIEDLVNRRGLGRSPRKDLLLFGGSSAGARGAMVHLDYVHEMMGNSTVASNVDVIGFLDSPLWIDIPPYPSSSFVGFNVTTAGVFAQANVTHLGFQSVRAAL